MEYPWPSYQQILRDLTLKISPESHCFVGHSLLSSGHSTFHFCSGYVVPVFPRCPSMPILHPRPTPLGVECTTYFTQSVHAHHRGSHVNMLGTHGKGGNPGGKVNCHSNGELTLIIWVDPVSVNTRVPINERGGRNSEGDGKREYS